MYRFYQPKVEDLDWLKMIIDESQPVSCEYSVGNIIGWCSHYGAKIREIDNCLVTKIDKNNLFGFPKGKNYENALKTIMSEYEYPSFYGLIENEKDELNRLYPSLYNFYESRDSFDYVYKVNDLANLEGKKYHSKRNHISYFMKNFDWKYEEINQGNMEECIDMNKKWYELNLERDQNGIENEHEVLDTLFNNYNKFNFIGGLLRVDGQVVAFTFGEKLNSRTFDTHFEKAFADMRGAYPMINMQFALNSLSDFEFVNREDDVGSEGLRKAKLSYYPYKLLEKYTAVRI